MWQLAYFQMAGSGKQRNQDALFNGQEVCYALLRKTCSGLIQQDTFLREY